MNRLVAIGKMRMIYGIAKQITDAFSAHGYEREVHPNEIKSWTGAELAHAAAWASSPAWDEPIPARVQSLVGRVERLHDPEWKPAEEVQLNPAIVARLRLLGCHFENSHGQLAFCLDEMTYGDWAPYLVTVSAVSWRVKDLARGAGIGHMAQAATDMSAKLDAMMGPKQPRTIVMASTPRDGDEDFVSKHMERMDPQAAAMIGSGIRSPTIPASMQPLIDDARRAIDGTIDADDLEASEMRSAFEATLCMPMGAGEALARKIDEAVRRIDEEKIKKVFPQRYAEFVAANEKDWPAHLSACEHPRWRQGCGPMFDAEVRAMEMAGAKMRYDEERDLCAPFERQSGIPVEWLSVGQSGNPERFAALMASIEQERKALAASCAKVIEEGLLSLPFERFAAAMERVKRAMRDQ